MKQQQRRIFGGQAKSKMAGGNAKPRKWSFNGAFASQNALYKPPFLEDQRTDNKKQPLFAQKQHERRQNLPSAPDAPRNTTSYIIRAKNSGGIVPCKSTPSTPSVPASVALITSPYKEDVVEQANQEWGVDSYGSMKGLLRVRHMNQQSNDLEPNLEKSVQVFEEKLERSLDLDISRFEMVYPSTNEIKPQSLEIRITDQDNQIAYLEETNTNLKERVFYMEQELQNLKRRMHVLEVSNAFRVREICSGEASFA